MTGEIVVVRPGALTTVQDGGRHGVAHLGVPRAGALDPAAMALANRLVGNGAGAAVLETTADGVAVRIGDDRFVAVTGAPAPVRLDGRPARWGLAVAVRGGQVLDVGAPIAGLRSYVALSGGLTPDPVLGSRSADLLSGLGPPVLVAGARLPLGAPAPPPPPVDAVPHPAPATELVLGCHLGPRDDELSAAGLRTLREAIWTVASSSNRIGLRLDGPALERANRAELAPEGLVLGSLQVPPDGRPVLFLADHPTTGGYPVVAVVAEEDLAACAQCRPGTRVRFRPAGLPAL